jgi:hypothetical protein
MTDNPQTSHRIVIPTEGLCARVEGSMWMGSIHFLKGILIR